MNPQLRRPFSSEQLKSEYGLEGIRLLPWTGLNVPFGGAYCIVRPGSSSLEHVNSPADEEELFVCVAGEASVVVGEQRFPARRGDVFFMPRGVSHYVANDGDEPFHFYALWWNKETAAEFLRRGQAESHAVGDYSI